MSKNNKYQKLQEELAAARDEIDRLNSEIRQLVQEKEALRESEEKYSKIFNFSPDSIALSRVKDGLFVDVNEKFTFFSGYTREEAIGKTVYELEIWYVTEDREQFVKELKQNGEVLAMDTRFKDKDGSIRHASIASRIIVINNEPYMVTFSHDITERKQNEEKLKKSEERFRNVITSLPVGFSYSDDLENILLVNKKFSEIFGYTIEDIPTIGSWIEKAVPDEDCRKTFLHYYRSLENEQDPVSKNISTEDKGCFITCRDGTVKDIEIIEIEDEGLVYAIFIDRTEQRRMKEALQISEEKYFKIFDFCPYSMSLSRVEDGLLVDINKRFTDLTGYTREEVVGRTSLDINLWSEPQDRKRFVKEMQRNGEVLFMYTRMRNKDGSNIHTSLSASTITINNELYMVIFCHDIKELKLSEEKLIESENRFRNLVTNFPMGITYGDNSGNILFVNDKFTEIFGYSQEDIPTVELWIDKVFPDKKAKKAFYLMNNALKRKSKKSIQQTQPLRMTEYSITCREGTIKEIETAAIMDKGYHCVVFIDITERKSTERALQELHKKYYHAELLMKQAEINALQAQINPHFLYNTLATIDSMALIKGEVEISEMCTALSKLFRYCIQQGEISTIGDEIERISTYLFVSKKRFKERLEYSITVDEKLSNRSFFKLIIQPLVENALKHGMEAKTEKVYVSVSVRKCGEDNIVIEVYDTGAGVSLDKLLEIKKELDAPYGMDSMNQENTIKGIGLKNVNNRIKLKYGSQYGLSFYSEEGKWTSAVITLPAYGKGN